MVSCLVRLTHRIFASVAWSLYFWRLDLSFSKRSLFDALAPALSSKETFIERSLSLRLGGTAMVALTMDLRSPSVRYFSRAWRVPERPVRRGSGEPSGSSGRYASVRRSGRVVCREGASARRPWVCGATDKPVTFSSLNEVRGDPRKLRSARENREAETSWSSDAASLLEVARRPAA
jgi:hypothetical protein